MEENNELISSLLNIIEYSNKKYILQTEKGLLLFVKKPVIDFLDTLNIEVDGNNKYYIINDVKYLYIGEADIKREGNGDK